MEGFLFSPDGFVFTRYRVLLGLIFFRSDEGSYFGDLFSLLIGELKSPRILEITG